MGTIFSQELPVKSTLIVFFKFFFSIWLSCQGYIYIEGKRSCCSSYIGNLRPAVLTFKQKKLLKSIHFKSHPNLSWYGDLKGEEKVVITIERFGIGILVLEK